MAATNVIFPTAWLNTLLDHWLNQDSFTYYSDLWINNYTIVDSSTIGSFTLGSANSIAHQALSTWSAAALVGSASWKYQSGPVTHTNTGGSPQSVYGYLITDGSSNPLWGQNDPNAPVTIVATSGTYKYTPGISTQSLF